MPSGVKRHSVQSMIKLCLKSGMHSVGIIDSTIYRAIIVFIIFIDRMRYGQIQDNHEAHGVSLTTHCCKLLVEVDAETRHLIRDVACFHGSNNTIHDHSSH